MPPHLRFSTAGLPNEEQARAYVAVHPAHDLTITTPEHGIDARVESWVLASMVLSVVEMDAVTNTRSAERVAADGIDAYGFVLSREGRWTGEFEGDRCSGGPGEVLVYDLARSNQVRSERSRIVILQIARDLLDEALAPFNMHGLVLRDGSGSLIADHIEALAQRLPTMPPRDIPALVRATRDLVAACLAPYRVERAGAADPAPLLPRAKRYIAANLKADLSVERLCEALGVSRTTLYRAFEPLGGVAAWVTQKRLQRIHTLLQRPGEHRTLSELAYAFGFVSADHFSRRFRAEYGYTATALRGGGLAARRSPPISPTIGLKGYPRLR